MEHNIPHQCTFSSHEDARDFLNTEKRASRRVKTIRKVLRDSDICENCDWMIGYISDKLTEN